MKYCGYGTQEETLNSSGFIEAYVNNLTLNLNNIFTLAAFQFHPIQ